VLPTLLLQTEELKTIDHMVSQLTDAQVIGILIAIVIVVAMGVVSVILQQRNFGKQQVSNAEQSQKLTDTFAQLFTRINDRLEEAQDNKAVLTTVIDNQKTLLAAQDTQATALLKIAELPGLLDQAIAVLQQTVISLREMGLTSAQYVVDFQKVNEQGFETIGERFDNLDMENGKILEQLKQLNENVTALASQVIRAIDLQQQASAADLKERRKLNDRLEALVSQAITRTGEHPVVQIETKSEQE
jgi:hypothetical protein